MPGSREHPFELRPTTIGERLAYFLTPFDQRYEDMTRGHLWLNVSRDLMAGLIVAMVAIPLAMGFAMASGLKPEQGIVGGAIAGLIGALFGGSKYQVYGPTAAFIPVIALMVHDFGTSFMILASICAGLILTVMGLFRMGRFVSLVPDSIVVGFTIGIACVIVTTQMGHVLDIKTELIGHSFLEKMRIVLDHSSEINAYA
ncbi:MAG: SulP family inorganic anion transporter, partial [Nitrospiraceae bacterium]